MTAPQAKTGVEVERFEPERYDEDRVRMELDSQGDYVRYTDFLASLAAERAEAVRMREALNLASVGEFAAQSANRHLSALVDFERQISERCMAVMKALMDAAEPVNNEFQDCHIDYADYAKFVDAHAELLYVIKNGERPAALSPSQGGRQ